MPVDPSFGRQNDLLQLVIETSPTGIVIADSQGKIASVNPQAADWLGYAPNELLGRPIEVLLPDNLMKTHSAKRMRYMQRPTKRMMADGKNLFARRKDGSQFPVDISLHPFDMGSGPMVLANIQDASRREESAANRTAMGSERLAAIREMATGLAHESRNALQRARACLELLELDFDDGANQVVLTNQIRDALEDVQKHYEEVKSYAAPMVLTLREANLLALCEEAFDELASLNIAFDYRLKVQENRKAVARVDSYLMKQLFRNVLENSVAASPDGSEVVASAHSTKLEGEPAVQVTISDKGEGFNPENASRLFEPFYTTKQHGTGLGLAVCRRIANAHDGKIYALNRDHCGTAVELVVPRRLG